MKTLRARLLAGISLASLAVTNSPAALAELPLLEPDQRVEPTAAEVASLPYGETRFGGAVAIDGDTAMVSMTHCTYAPCNPAASPPVYPQGRIAIFNRAASGEWQRVGALDPGPNERFLNFRVVLKGDTALVAGQTPVTGTTVIYVFRRIQGVWTKTTTLSPPPGRPVVFGLDDALDYDHDTIAVGATYQDDFTGTVFLYRLNAAGQVAASTQVYASDTQPVALGARLDLLDDTLVAVGYTQTTKGVYVFQRIGNQWTQTQKLVTTTESNFGSAVALNAHGALLIGDSWAQNENYWTTPDGHGAAGVVYALTGTNGVFNYHATLRPTPDQIYRYTDFGQRIITDGDRAVISARLPQDEGVAVVYEPRGNEAVATWTAQFHDWRALSMSGDRMILGSPFYVDDNYSYHEKGWAELYTLPPIASYQ
jgi:hypothetical protein